MCWMLTQKICAPCPRVEQRLLSLQRRLLICDKHDGIEAIVVGWDDSGPVCHLDPADLAEGLASGSDDL